MAASDEGDHESLSGEDDDLYGADGEDSPYEFDDADAPAAAAAAVGSPAAPEATDHIGTWQSDMAGPVLDATSTESTSLFTSVPSDPKTYLQRVARREKQAAMRCSILELRAHFTPLFRRHKEGAPDLTASQVAAAENLVGIIGEPGDYCLAALERSGWDQTRAINWHLTGAGRADEAFVEASKRYQGVSLHASAAAAPVRKRRAVLHELHGHGLCMAMSGGLAEPGATVQIPDSAMRLKQLPAVMQGGALIKLSAIGKEGRSTADADALAVSFETYDSCNVFVCIHSAVVTRGWTPDWLNTEGFELQHDDLVSTTDGNFFVVFRASSLEPKQWKLGNNATAIPMGTDVPARSAMYFVVVTTLDTDTDTEGLRLATTTQHRNVSQVLTDLTAVHEVPRSAVALAAASSAAVTMTAGGIYEAAASMASITR